MPTTDVPVVETSTSGIVIGSDAAEVPGDTSNGHSMQNTGGEPRLIVRNDGGSVRSIVFATVGTVDGQATGNRTESIPANATGLIFGPFRESDYNVRSGDDKGKLTFTVDHADLKLLAIK